MIFALYEALKALLEDKLAERWREASTGEFEPLTFQIGGALPRSKDGKKNPYILIVPLSGEDEERSDMEVIALDIVPCVFVSKPNESSHIEEGTRDIINLLELIKKAVRTDDILAKRFEFTGKISWALPDFNDHPKPHFYAVVRVEYRTPIMAETLKEEVERDGSVYP